MQVIFYEKLKCYKIFVNRIFTNHVVYCGCAWPYTENYVPLKIGFAESMYECYIYHLAVFTL